LASTLITLEAQEKHICAISVAYLIGIDMRLGVFTEKEHCLSENRTHPVTIY